MDDETKTKSSIKRQTLGYRKRLFSPFVLGLASGNLMVRVAQRDTPNPALESRIKAIADLDPRLKRLADKKADRVTHAMKAANNKTHLFRIS